MRRRKIIAKDGTVSYGRWRTTVDLTNENAEKLRKIISNTTINETQIINKLISKSSIPSSYPLAPTHKELQGYVREINKIGTNINQIAKRFNSETGMPDKLIHYYLSEINSSLIQLESISEEIRIQTSRIVEVLTK